MTTQKFFLNKIYNKIKIKSKIENKQLEIAFV